MTDYKRDTKILTNWFSKNMRQHLNLPKDSPKSNVKKVDKHHYLSIITSYCPGCNFSTEFRGIPHGMFFHGIPCGVLALHCCKNTEFHGKLSRNSVFFPCFPRNTFRVFSTEFRVEYSEYIVAKTRNSTENFHGIPCFSVFSTENFPCISVLFPCYFLWKRIVKFSLRLPLCLLSYHIISIFQLQLIDSKVTSAYYI